MYDAFFTGGTIMAADAEGAGAQSRQGRGLDGGGDDVGREGHEKRGDGGSRL